MRILLTGATGFLGQRILEQLSVDSSIEKVIAGGRTLRDSGTVKNSKVIYELGNLEDEEYAYYLVRNSDLIINAAALSSPWGKENDFINANVVTQRNLIKAANQFNLTKFIYISTPSLYFNSKNRILIKESDLLPAKFINAYAKTKRQAEVLLEKSKIPYIILRPRGLIGRGDTVIMPRLIRASKEDKLKIIGNGKNIVDLTTVDNVVDAVMLSIHSNHNCLNQIYNISNGEPILLWEYIAYVLSLLDRKLPKNRIPYFIALFVAQLMEIRSRLTNNKEPALTRYGVGTLSKSFTLDISKARRLLNYNPRKNTKQAIDEFAKWYLSNEGSKTVSE